MAAVTAEGQVVSTINSGEVVAEVVERLAVEREAIEKEGYKHCTCDRMPYRTKVMPCLCLYLIPP